MLSKQARYLSELTTQPSKAHASNGPNVYTHAVWTLCKYISRAINQQMIENVVETAIYRQEVLLGLKLIALYVAVGARGLGLVSVMCPDASCMWPDICIACQNTIVSCAHTLAPCAQTLAPHASHKLHVLIH